MDRIGFVGLGAMGTPMAWNVDAAGFELGVYNRSAKPTEQFAAEGVDVYDSPADLAGDVDAVVTMVTGPEALGDVIGGEAGVTAGLADGTVVVNTSTVSRQATTTAAEDVRGAGGAFVDAPVLGTVGPAEQGELLVLAGADDDVLERVRPLLDTFGEVASVGDVGDGTSAKLTTNLLLGVMMEGFSEALAFADAQGLDLETVLDVIDRGVISSPLYSVKADAVRERDFSPQFPVDLLFKDLNLVLDAAGEDRTPLPATGAVREAANETRALGHGDEDMTALLRRIEDVTGRTVGEG
ncbi:MAG: NAD(P)-dependent oxidoreductase [Haloarculaceae archaeon]